MLRTVLDSNVVLAADRASNPLSPNKEIINRWSLGEFIWLVTADIVAEYAEKLLDKGNAASEVEAFIAELFLLAECVEIRFFHFRHYPVDAIRGRSWPGRSCFTPALIRSPLSPKPRMASNIELRDQSFVRMAAVRPSERSGSSTEAPTDQGLSQPTHFNRLPQ